MNQSNQPTSQLFILQGLSKLILLQFVCIFNAERKKKNIYLFQHQEGSCRIKDISIGIEELHLNQQEMVTGNNNSFVESTKHFFYKAKNYFSS